MLIDKRKKKTPNRMNKINKLIDYLVFKGDKQNVDDQRKGRFFIVSMFLIFTLQVLYVPFYLGDSVDTVPLVKPLFYLSLIILLSIFFIYPKLGYRNLLFIIFCLFSATSSFISTYYTTGGLYSSDLGLSVVMILFIFLVTNKVIGICATILHILVYSFFYFADINEFHDFKSDFLSLPANYYLTTTIICFTFSTVIILLHETSKDKYLSELKKSKAQIEAQKEEIISSITYAKRIQQAKLPRKEDIYCALRDSFILFKPKDIVSGDFYFFQKNERFIFIASADCTGHGVPGAIMSILCSEKLEDAISKSNDTSEILKISNKSIKASLQQSDSNESTRDGMDIALCSIDSVNGVVKYAGANRPIWIIRTEQTEVEEIKATKTAIGGLTEDNQHFETHEIKLKRGDTFYICTDGYADQFSGQDGKKLMTKKFKEILISIQNKTMQEQEKYLDNFVENWKAGTEQVDDILVIGVRF
jgi:serine phosphatase RsbU (regulator of sigma subunit)